MRKRSWHELRPDLVEEIRADLAAHFPTLHLFIERRTAEVRGTFPVRGDERQVLDRFAVTITLPFDYPRELPVTRETGGRIPWTAKRHVEDNGVACVLLPDERWRVFPVGARFLAYLKGPLHSFFLSQLAVEAGDDWPFGEWGHGARGILDHYYELLGVRRVEAVLRYLRVLKRPKLKPNRRCPCGTGKAIQECCRDRLVELRSKIDPTTAARSYESILSEVAKAARRPQAIVPGTGSPGVLLRAAGSTRGVSG